MFLRRELMRRARSARGEWDNDELPDRPPDADDAWIANFLGGGGTRFRCTEQEDEAITEEAA